MRSIPDENSPLLSLLAAAGVFLLEGVHCEPAGELMDKNALAGIRTRVARVLLPFI